MQITMMPARVGIIARRRGCGIGYHSPVVKNRAVLRTEPHMTTKRRKRINQSANRQTTNTHTLEGRP